MNIWAEQTALKICLHSSELSERQTLEHDAGMPKKQIIKWELIYSHQYGSNAISKQEVRISSELVGNGTDWSRTRYITQGPAEEALIRTASWATKTLIKLLEDPEVGRTEYVWPLTLMQACKLDLNGKGMRAAGMVKLLTVNQMICTTNHSCRFTGEIYA